MPQLVELKRVPSRFKSHCPFCRTIGTPETLYHLFFECRAWRKQRYKNGLMGTIGEVRRLEGRLARLSDRQRVAFDSSGMLALSRSELATAWILGGVPAVNWG